MVIRNEEEVKYIDMTPDVKTDTFVNEDYREATISNIGRYLESPDINEFQRRVKERIALVK